jgi:Tfp pilus assembly protein PilX
MHTNPRRAQRGATLFEALVAFLVLSLGMVAIARLQGHLRLDADVVRQRSEAVRLAQEDMEGLRSFGLLNAAPGTRSFDAIASAARSVDTGSASYLIERRIAPVGALPRTKSAAITVSWTDRSGGAQHVTLHSIVAGSDPALSAALALASR